MEARADVSARGRTGRVPAWVLGAVPLALIALALATFALLDGPGLTDRTGPPVEELAVERTVLEPGRIDLTVRNDGPDDVTLAQVIVNDGFADFSATDSKLGHLDTSKVSIRYHWVEGDAYEVQLLTSTGATIAHEIPVAVETPDTDLGFYGLMALLGLYVGIVPVTLGMLWLPFVRRIDPRWLRVLMALTVGLLGVPRDRRDPGGHRRLRPGLAGARRRGARVPGRAHVVPGPEWRGGVAAGATGEELQHHERGARRDAGRHRDRPPQPGRGTCDRLGVRGRGTGAGRVPGDRLCAAQHHRGPGDRGPGGKAPAGPGPARPARADRRSAGDRGRVDRRLGVQREPGGVPAGRRRRRDRAGDPAARALDQGPRRARAQPFQRAGILAGFALLYATSLLVAV